MQKLCVKIISWQLPGVFDVSQIQWLWYCVVHFTFTCTAPSTQWNVECVQLWDLGAGKQLTEFKDHTAAVTVVKFHPNEFFLASGSTDRCLFTAYCCMSVLSVTNIALCIFTFISTALLYYNTNIYNLHIVTHQGWIGGSGSHQVARRSVLIVNELRYEVRVLSGARNYIGTNSFLWK